MKSPRSSALTLIRITLTFDGRWAVGHQAKADAEVKLPILLDPRTSAEQTPRPHLPATGLAGSLRRHLGTTATHWLGPEPSGHEVVTGKQSGEAGKRRGALQFLGTLPIDIPFDQRGVTAVDTGRGAALKGTLRNEQWAEPGVATVVALHEGARDAALMADLASWRPVVGRSRTTGMGRTHVSGLTSATIDLDNPAHLHWWLVHRDGWLRGDAKLPSGVIAVDDTALEPVKDDPVWELGFLVVERIHAGTGGFEVYEGREAASPLRSGSSRERGKRTLVVPGSTWKGLYRHRCETILRLVGGTKDQIDTIIGVLFGSPTTGRGRLTFSDTRAATAKASVRRHVAIDRFTGGARDSALVTVLSIPEGEKLTLRIRSDGALPNEARNLLLHVTRDLSDGLIGLGGHATRGYGTVRLDKAGMRLLDGLSHVDVASLQSALAPEQVPEETTA